MDQVRNAWVERVLGVRISPVTQRKVPDLLAIWSAAKEKVDTGLTALSSGLRDQGDPDLERIADLGLFRVGAREVVGLVRALYEYNQAGPEARTARAEVLREAVKAYRGTLATPLAGLIDENPLGIEVGLRSTLTGALNEIDRALP